MVRTFLSILGRIGGYLIAFVIGIILVHGWFKANFLEPVSPHSTEKVFFEVSKGSNLRKISEDLEKRGVIKHWYALYYLSKLKADTDQLKILAGEYELSPSMTPMSIFAALTSGKIVQHPLTIPPGVTMSDVAAIMAKTGLVTLDESMAAMNDRNLMIELDIPAVIPEGYLFPETYLFSRPIDAKQMIVRIVQEGNKRMDDGIRNWRERAKELGFTPYQLLTLASIVEKETGKAEERGRIASVFHNRLRIGMPLQSDPTVIYGIPNFSGNITKEDLKAPGPYNTYINTGLPPTPICNPGLDSLKASLYPDDTDYLYFVSKGDGSHQFSATYKEHQSAVNSFQKGIPPSSSPPPVQEGEAP